MARLRTSERLHGRVRENGLFLVETDAYAGKELFEHKTSWRALRGVLAVTNDAEYAEARDLADGARRDLPGEYHAAIAFAFPDEPWGDEAAEALLASTEDGRWEPAQMVITVASVAHAVRIARLGYPIEPPFALTLLARHGASAVPVLAAALGAVTERRRRKEIGDSLALVATREALEAFLPLLGVSAVSGPLGRAFRAQPELGKQLLARAATQSGKSATAAKALLVKLG
jgi:hypothetical protein